MQPAKDFKSGIKAPSRFHNGGKSQRNSYDQLLYSIILYAAGFRVKYYIWKLSINENSLVWWGESLMKNKCCVVLYSLFSPFSVLNMMKRNQWGRELAGWSLLHRKYLQLELDKHSSTTASSKLPNNKYKFETEINLQSLYVDKVNVW